MKTLVLVLLFTTACFANGQSTAVAPSVAGPSSVAMGSTTAMPAGTTSMAPPQSTQVASSSATTPQSSSVAPSSQVMSSSPSLSASSSPSVSPSQSMSSSASMSPSMSSSASMSPSMSVSPSASSSVVPASSRAPTNPPTTNPTTTAPKQHYDVDVKVQDEKTGKPCLWFKATINVTYQHENVSGQISLSGKDATTTGTCSDLTKSNETSEVTLNWTDEKITSMTAQFSAGSKNSWYFSKIGVVFNIPASSNGLVTAEKTFKEDENTEFLHASHNKSYSCAIPESLALDSKQVNVTMNIIDIMVQPFTHNNTLVKDNDSCSSKSKSSKSSSIVPIAVGCALAGLIVIVLIAYLIGRRKNDGRGYQQV